MCVVKNKKERKVIKCLAMYQVTMLAHLPQVRSFTKSHVSSLNILGVFKPSFKPLKS